MFEFIHALTQYQFLQYALLAGLLASVSCGVVGTYVVTRRISYLAGAIAHCVLGGLGAARYLQTVAGWQWMDPIYGALVAAIAAALIIGVAGLRFRQREDTVIGALWAIGMAVGLLFIARTPGYNEALLSYLFGNILMVAPRELWLMAGMDVAVLAVVFMFHNKFLAICFDEEFASLKGLRVEFYYLLLLCLTAVTVVLLMTVVGIVLVIALITLPAAVAGHYSRRLWHMMILASLFSMAFTTIGLATSYTPDLPAGAVIICVAAGVYLVSALGTRLHYWWRSGRNH